MEAQERAETRKADMEMRLKIRSLEIEAEKKVTLRKLELEPRKVDSVTFNPVGASPVASDVSTAAFDVGKHISLVPHFRETEVDTYFSAFERLASALKWPKEVWSLLLQCRLVGKAQAIISALPVEDSLDYETVKNAILCAYELVPEAYRQRFRNQKKTAQQTFVEFAREKGILFDKWVTASKTKDFNSLRDLMLLEEFKNCLSERVVTYLNEQKVTNLSQAAVLADEFVLTHKSVFVSTHFDKRLSLPAPQNLSPRVKVDISQHKEMRECFYCHKTGHVIADCLTLQRKQSGPPKPVNNW